MDVIHAQGGLVYIPHPFEKNTRKTSLSVETCSRLKDKIDIIEVFNSRTLSDKDNQLADKFASEAQKLKGVRSDAHTKFEVGNAYVEMKPFSNKKEFLLNLKKAKLFTKKTPLWVFLITKYVRFKKKLKGGTRW